MAQPVITLDDRENFSVDLLPTMEQLQSTSFNIGIEDIVKPEFANSFTSQTQHPSAITSHHFVWARIQILNPTMKPITLYLSNRFSLPSMLIAINDDIRTFQHINAESFNSNLNLTPDLMSRLAAQSRYSDLPRMVYFYPHTRVTFPPGHS